MSEFEDIMFHGNSFCFTGKLAELKREQAERETRARGGLTSKVVNEDLNYLVIGSIPSIGWKHGSYGNKIEKAMAISSKSKKLKLVSEPYSWTVLPSTEN